MYSNMWAIFTETVIFVALLSRSRSNNSSCSSNSMSFAALTTQRDELLFPFLRSLGQELQSRRWVESTKSVGNYPSASDLISIPNHQCTCKKVIVRPWPSLFVISPSRRWRRELFLKQKAFQLIAMCECKHEKQHNLFPSFSRGMKNTRHRHWQIVSVHSSARTHTHTYIYSYKQAHPEKLQESVLPWSGRALVFIIKWHSSAIQTLHYKQQLPSILATEVWMMVTTLCAQTQSHEFCNCFDAFFKRGCDMNAKNT